MAKLKKKSQYRWVWWILLVLFIWAFMSTTPTNAMSMEKNSYWYCEQYDFVKKKCKVWVEK